CDELPPKLLACPKARTTSHGSSVIIRLTSPAMIFFIMFLPPQSYSCGFVGLPFAGGSAPGEGSGCGWANGMGFALAAFDDQKLSAGTVGSSCQSERIKLWRSRSGSSR